MQSQQVDVAKRMKEVAAVMATPLAVLEEQGVTVEELEGEAHMRYKSTRGSCAGKLLPCSSSICS